jgi:hypothetical protein
MYSGRLLYIFQSRKMLVYLSYFNTTPLKEIKPLKYFLKALSPVERQQ